MSRRSRVLPLVALLVLAVPSGAALAVTKNGITPKAPRAGAKVPAGESPTFRMAVKGNGSVWVHVCGSRKRNAKGVICGRASVGRARERGRTFRYTPKFFDYPRFWLNRPGVYYWQAYRIACEEADTKDCLQEGPVVRFRVR